MPIVFDNLEIPGTTPAELKRVNVYLVASLDDSAIGGNVDDQDVSIFDRQTGLTNAAGYIAFSLRANTTIDPNGTYYVWDTHLSDGQVWRRLIQVPAGAGPYAVGDLEVTPPDDLPERLGFYNLVTDFGARIDSNGTTGNGTDDRQAWIDALAAMALTGRPLWIPHGVTGISRISTGIGGIFSASGKNFVFYAHGGAAGPFAAGGQVEVTFDSGGFEFIYGVSGGVRMHNLYVIGVNAPALWMNNAAGMSLHNTCLRGYGTNAPGLKSTDNFFMYADSDCSFMSGDTATPSILIEETSGTGGGEAWDYYFKGCRLNIGNIKLTVGISGPSVVGEQLVFEDIVGENFAASTPVLDVVWTDDYALHEITLARCNVADSSTPFGIRFTNNSGSSCTVYNLIVEQCLAGVTDIVKCAGSDVVAFSSALILGLGQRIAPGGATTVPTYVTLDNTDGAWRSFSNVANGNILIGKKASDSFDRCYYAFDGVSLGAGAAAPELTLLRTGTNKLKIKGADTSTQTTVQFDSPDANHDIDLQFLINGSVKGDIYVDHTTNEFIFYKAGAILRADTSKVGFLGAAPVVRQTLGAAATDAGTTQTLANNLRTAMINLGLGQT